MKKNSFDYESVVKVFKGMLISGGSVALLYLLEWLTTCDFGDFTALVVGLLAVLINTIKSFKQGE